VDAFIRFLGSEDARHALERHGFGTEGDAPLAGERTLADFGGATEARLRLDRLRRDGALPGSR